MYTEKARLLPPNCQVVEGQKAIEEFWKGVMDSGIKKIELKTVEVESFGDTIVELGTATLYGKAVEKAKYFVMWKRVNGTWKLHRDCWNSSEPAPKK
jgi:ketosteroid isomerase-like protein